jgi:ABC-2 type transport system permease protein/lipopolysaccharide transport system permease protein
MTREIDPTMQEVIQSAALWPIWVRLGVQDVKLRFRRSAVGPAWIFVNLAVLIVSIGFIYAHLLGQEAAEFVPYLTIGLIAWSYLTNSIVDGGNAFILSAGYIKQISLPIYVYVLRSFVSIGLTSLIMSAAFVIVAVIYPVPLAVGTLFVIPGLLIMMVTSLLLITIFAHWNARFRDVAQTASVGMQVLFYVTPVIFPATMLLSRGSLRYVVELNPMYHLLEVIRRPLLTGQAAEWESYVAAGIIIVVLAAIATAVLATYRRRIVFAL